MSRIEQRLAASHIVIHQIYDRMVDSQGLPLRLIANTRLKSSISPIERWKEKTTARR
jgi:hypothetical protein